MENYKETSTPMSTSYYMDADLAGTTVDQTKFRGLIGSLLYLTARRLDIMFAVFLCARFQLNPKESHFKVVKQILKYLKCTTRVGLWYSSHYPINLVGYSSSDFAASWIERPKVAHVIFLEQVSYLGIARSKLVWLSQLQRLSILLLVVVCSNSFCTDQVISVMTCLARARVGRAQWNTQARKDEWLGSGHSRRSLNWRSPISSVRNRRSPELRHSRRMRMLGDRVVYTPPQGAHRRISQ